jgi:hypothetical protein
MYLTVSSGNAKTFSENLTEDFACLSRFVLACVVLPDESGDPAASKISFFRPCGLCLIPSAYEPDTSSDDNNI